jgi:tight adherence protein B
MSVVLQHETGGNLIELLEQIAHTIRERDKFRGKVAALTAESKTSGAIMAALPLFVVLVISGSNPGYLRLLAEDPTGRMIALAGILLWLTGGLWLYRLSRVEL